MAQPVKNLPAMQEIWVCFLGGEDPLERGMATHSSILAQRIPWGRKESATTEQLTHTPHIAVLKQGDFAHRGYLEMPRHILVS